MFLILQPLQINKPPYITLVYCISTISCITLLTSQKDLLTIKGEIMHKPIVFMFSGQGSQYFHMGKALYQSLPTFRNSMDRLDNKYFLCIDRQLCHLVHL